jgi:hypothetical protein
VDTRIEGVQMMSDCLSALASPAPGCPEELPSYIYVKMKRRAAADMARLCMLCT